MEVDGSLEDEIQDWLDIFDITVVWDRYNVSNSDNKWIAIIHISDLFEREIEALTDGGFWGMHDAYFKLCIAAEKDSVYIGVGSPEVALTKAMDDVRKAYYSNYVKKRKIK